MEKLFILNPKLDNVFDLHDAITERIEKAHAIIAILAVGNDMEFNPKEEIINHALWVVGDFLLEIGQLQEKFWDLYVKKS